MSTDEEFAEYLKSLPRVLGQAEIDRRTAEHDRQLGPYVPHGGEVHHYAFESRH